MLRHPLPPLVIGGLLPREAVIIRSHNRDQDRGHYDIHPASALVGVGWDRVRHETRPRHGFVGEHIQRQRVLLFVGGFGRRRHVDVELRKIHVGDRSDGGTTDAREEASILGMAGRGRIDSDG